MKITKLISFYKKCLSDPLRIYRHGFCVYAYYKYSRFVKRELAIYYDVKRIFNKDNGHYKHWIGRDKFLFKPLDWKKRDEFAKKEIVRLQKLLKKGYTHV